MVAIASEIAVSTVTSPTLAALIALDVGAALQRDLRDHLDEALELLVARNEIGLRVDFDHDALGARRQRADQAFRRDAAGLLGGLRQALLAQPILRFLHVAVGFGEGCLAVHHARAGRLAQFLDHRRRDRCHRRISFLPVSRGRGARFAPCRRQLQGMLSREEQSRWPESRPRGVTNYSASAISVLACATQASARLGRPTSSPILCAVS